MVPFARRALAGRSAGARDGFRWRGVEVSRLEGFTDAVFAFAVTLLIVSLEVPHTFGELVTAMRGFFAFAICFTLLYTIWYEHYRYSRRYGLDDTVVVALNGALLFVVLFYVYPLKFVFTMFVGTLLGYDTSIRHPGGVIEPMVRAADAPTLFLIFGAGYVAVFLVFALLYLHAYSRRHELELNEIETFDTRAGVISAIATGAVGAASVAMTLALGSRANGWNGFIYFANGPVQTALGFWAGSNRRRIEEATARNG